MENPFRSDVFQSASQPLAEVASLHAEDSVQLARRVEERLAGEDEGLILLTSREAGYGKSHLLWRLQRDLGSRIERLTLRFPDTGVPTWRGLLLRTLHWLSRSDREGICRMTLLARRVFARLLTQLLRSGEIPCSDPEAYAKWLPENADLALDVASQEHEVARWLAGRYGGLRPLLAEAFSQLYAVPEPESGFWGRQFFWALAEEGGPSVCDAIDRGELGHGSESLARENFGVLSRVLADCLPVWLDFDHWESWQGESEGACREAAAFLGELGRGPLPVVAVVNQDWWQRVLEPTLTSAVRDRLTASEMELGGILLPQAEELLESLVKVQGSVDEPTWERFRKFVALDRRFLERGEESWSVRAVLRVLQQAWEDFFKLESLSQTRVPALLPPAKESDEPLADEPEETEEEAEEGAASPKGEQGEPLGASAPLTKENVAPAREFQRRSTASLSPLVANGVHHPEPPESEPPLSSREVAPPSAGNFYELLKELEGLRKENFPGEEWWIDYPVLEQVLAESGRLVPFVRSHRELAHERAFVVWRVPGQRIILGGRPPQEEEYWEALLQAESSRALEEGVRSKTVLFLKEGESWQPREWSFASAASLAEGRLDVVRIDATGWSTLFGISRLLLKYGNDRQASRLSALLRLLNQEMRFVWRRLLREAAAS
ncbi:MAG: hypothetical protein AAF555_06165 [Verrucomicrobiota bacterium]